MGGLCRRSWEAKRIAQALRLSRRSLVFGLLVLLLTVSCLFTGVPSSRPAIIGTWQSTDIGGGIWEFRPDGTLRLNIWGEHATWSYEWVDSDTVEITNAFGETISYSVVLEDDRLTLDDGERVYEFVRVP